MANIMMTDACNLSCPYCFANEFVNKECNEISEENFDKAVEFIVGDGCQSTVGLIGGEPTIHSQFDLLLRKLIRDERVHHIMIYTNGVRLDEYLTIITHSKISLLINCNSPVDIGNVNYKKICQNLDYLLLECMLKDRITLGFNMYGYDFEYDYFVELLKRYQLKKARISITVPNTNEKRNVNAHRYFMLMKPRLMQFLQELLANEIIPNFDCNKIPSCLITDDDISLLKKYMNCENVRKNIGKSNIANPVVRCAPVIDIRQDLTAVRCFGLSEYTKVKISEFNSISELYRFYIRSIDAFAYNTVYSEKCSVCRKRKVTECMGGCLAFKIDDIEKMQRYADNLQKNHIVEM